MGGEPTSHGFRFGLIGAEPACRHISEMGWPHFDAAQNRPPRTHLRPVLLASVSNARGHLPHLPPPSVCTYTASALMVAGSSRPVHAGITPERPLAMVSMMSASCEPNSHIWSVRFG